VITGEGGEKINACQWCRDTVSEKGTNRKRERENKGGSRRKKKKKIKKENEIW